MSYHVLRAGNTAVELWSGYRIQYQNQERHDWQKQAKVELKAALNSLGLLQEQVTQLVTRPDQPVWS